ncbi:unnamed protein product (macronuclear) [Paramecium tetraurelia]|uniref:Transmembrane protein n=1 Tax=Paramecium tetraurelia TaxID=5888 RepID=A0E405_PARTE|nr:uncharacterized protein GSPATT00023195001 [Paramecium tetraurelia]CAK90022.1 unnamed protein product [Paramecium tetraurelia]|eukprot:XP_001457419.1 hypothetical protein (macronuclear) [Paramecium tetraurelia strain d4-2]
MLNFLQQIDQFGVQQKLQIPPIKPTQKSALGGLVTLILYGASLGYFLFQILDWQSNNKLPKVTFIQSQINYAQKLKLQGVFAEISYMPSLNNPIDPFNPQNLIFSPHLRIIPYDRQNIQSIPLKFDQEQLENGKILNKFLIQDIEPSSSPVNSLIREQTNYQLSLGYCNIKLLQEGQFCANQDTIDQFFSQTNFFQVFIYIQQFDPKTKSLKLIPKYFIFDMIKDQLYFTQFILKVGELNMDDGFLFPNSNEYTFLSDLQIVSAQYDQEYSKNMYGEELISILFFNLDQIKIVNNVEYPKISEILADTGSIVTWILSISFIVSNYNETLSLESTQRNVISMYFNDFTDFSIKKNWLGKIISVNFKGREYDTQKSEEILNRLNQIAVEKMNYLNLQNEVAKLQLIVQEHLGLQQINKYLETKYQLDQLFDQLGIPEKVSQQAINQIQAQNEQQSEGISQLNLDAENDSRPNKLIILEQELESRMGLLDIKKYENGGFKQLNSNLQVKESFQNLNTYVKVSNLEKSVDVK